VLLSRPRYFGPQREIIGDFRTRREALLQLLCATGILDDVGVEVARAPDLELDLVRLLVLLYARRC
jgi:hypothetical protein